MQYFICFNNYTASSLYFFCSVVSIHHSSFNNRKPEPYLWKLDRTENYSRMRMRLARNYNVNKHTDASQLRDTGTVLASKPEPTTADTSLLSKLTAKRESIASFVDEEDALLEQIWSDASSPGAREEVDEPPKSLEKEKTVKSFQCDLITLMDRTPGRLEITTKHLYFSSEQQDKKETQTCEFEKKNMKAIICLLLLLLLLLLLSLVVVVVVVFIYNTLYVLRVQYRL